MDNVQNSDSFTESSVWLFCLLGVCLPLILQKLFIS
jgi:hypothetical protein